LFDTIGNGVNGTGSGSGTVVASGGTTGNTGATNGTAIGSSKRRSTLLTPASTTKRRQSNYQISSSQLSSQQTPQPLSILSLQTPSSSQQAPDQRPLRDKNYQNLIIQEIYDFLVINQFERISDHPLTLKTLRQPTQKDFTLIFRFLYHKIDPSHEFNRAIDIEVFALLRNLGYPYLDSINRSQISAVGGQNWPSFLGMLYWLVKLNLNLAVIDTNDDLLLWPEDEVEKLVAQFLLKSYTAFLNEHDSFDDYLNELSRDFDVLKQKLADDIINLQSESTELNNQFTVLNKQVVELQQSETKSQALEGDLVKFNAYIETMESRKSKWAQTLEKINDEIANQESNLQQLNKEKQELETRLVEQGITITEINNLNQERDRCSKSIETVTHQIEDLNHIVRDNEIDLIKNFQSIENFVKQYNNVVEKIKSPNHDFTITLNPDIVTNRMANSSRALSVTEIIDKSLKQEKIAFLKLRNEIQVSIHKFQDDHLKLQEQCDNLKEKNIEQVDVIDSISSKVAGLKNTYEEMYETMVNRTTTSTTEIERLERDMRAIKVQTDQEYITLENTYQNISMKYDELTHSTSRSRAELYEKCQKISNFVGNFILDNRTYLLHLADFTDMQFETEQNDIAPSLQDNDNDTNNE
jgi:kinetochore protein NDC80